MKEYEITARFCNACAGASRPQTFFEEAELENLDDYIHMKHGAEFSKFTREDMSPTQLRYSYDNGSVMYVYEFAEI